MPVESVATWLKGLGLERYAQVFADNDVDFDVLPYLTEADLEKLGVSLGHRKRLLAAIAALEAAPLKAGEQPAGAAPPLRQPSREIPSPAPQDSAPADPAAADVGERRHLTVLFCDMVGFTEIADRVDPEVLQKIIHGYEDACAACVMRYEGYVFQRLGDGIVAFFGYPYAHENEAERAIRAALEILGSMHRLEFPDVGRLSVRIGIASGLVVVRSASQGAVGDTMIIAARLQGIAQPDCIVVSARVHHLAGAGFLYVDLGEQVLKGIAKPMRVWRVIGVRRVESRFHAAHLADLTPFVGRESESRLLHALWAKAVAGHGQAVAIGGEAGIGKSRLARTIVESTRTDPVVWMTELQCSPFHTQSALFPVADQLRRQVFQDEQSGDDASRWLALENYLRRTSLPVVEVLPLFAQLLSVAPPAGHPAPTLTPERARLLTRQFLVALIIDLAKSGPGIVIIEDLHWADPSTIDLIDFLIERMRGTRILLVLTHRPEFDHALAGWAHVERISLARLRGADAAELVRLCLGNADLNAEVMREVSSKTDGVPLYIEEFTKAVVESREKAISAAMAQVVIPDTLHDSLLSRLDHLGEAKAVAQLAAMLGHEFRSDVLAAVWTGDSGSLGDSLERLVRGEFIYALGEAPNRRYVFKHALIRDAAYESLLRSHRVTQHRRIAERLEERFADIVADQPEVLAHHYTLGKNPERAAQFWLQGGRRSLRRNAHVEAAAHLRGALGAVAELHDGPARHLAELDVQITLGTALIAAKGYASADVEAAWVRAQELCSLVGGVPQQVPALFGLWMFECVRANHPAALALAQTLVQMAEAAGSDDLRIEAYLGRGISHFFLGEVGAAKSSLAVVLETYRPERHGGHRFQFGQDPAAIALIYLGWLSWLEGDGREADALFDRATAFARSLEHPFTLSFVLTFAGWHQQYCREVARAELTSGELIRLCTEEQIPVFLTHGLVLAGWSLCERGEPEGPAVLLDAIEKFRATGSRCFLPYWYAFRADALAKRGERAAALECIDAAHTAMEATAERWAEPELHRLTGCVLEQTGAGAAAVETCYRRALDAARERGMTAWALRAEASLARMSQETLETTP
jgi:class 3 adenylate cyclase/tetratricopeptide (TPR) repeat protein